MLKERSNQSEWMDELSLTGHTLWQTLKELNVINKRLGGNQISLSAFSELAKKQKKCMVLADLGCGSGDMMKKMAERAKKKGFCVKFIGFDANPNIVGYANAHTSEHPEITYESLNVLSEEFATKKFDIIHCCLFLHHFRNEQLIELFKQFRSQARVGVIINDLHRHVVAYFSIKWLTLLFSKSSMVRNDATVSVARGFKKKELEEMLEKAGIREYQLKWKWAFRWKLVF